MKRLLTIIAAAGFAATGSAADKVMADITFENGNQIRAYLVSANGSSISYSVSPDGTASSSAKMDQVKFLQTHAPDEYIEAENNYRLGDFEKAEEQFRQLATEYASIAALKDDIGSFSKYYFLKSLRANGKLAELNDEIDKMRESPFALSETYAQDAAWLVPWGMIGKENWQGLLDYVAGYYDSTNKDENPTPQFVTTVPRSKLAELSYFRALATEKLGKPEDAIKDYYRASTLNRGADRQITQESLLSLMRLVGKQETENPSYLNKTEMHTLATFYKLSFGEGELPPQYVRHLIPPPDPSGNRTAPKENPEPEDPQPEETKPEDEKKPDPADDAPDAPADGAADPAEPADAS